MSEGKKPFNGCCFHYKNSNVHMGYQNLQKGSITAMSNCLYTLAHVQHSCLKSACVTRLPTAYLNENLTHPAGKLDSQEPVFKSGVFRISGFQRIFFLFAYYLFPCNPLWIIKKNLGRKDVIFPPNNSTQ